MATQTRRAIGTVSDGGYIAVGGGTAFGPELQPNSDLSGTGGGFAGTPGASSGEISDDWNIFVFFGATCTASKDGSDSQAITTTGGGIALIDYSVPLTSGTLYKAVLTISDITGSIRWNVASTGDTNIQFDNQITSDGTYVQYFVADTTASDFGNRVTLDDGESCTISEASIKEVTASNLHDCINERVSDGDSTYIRKDDAEGNYVPLLQNFMINAVADTINVYASNIFRITSDSPATDTPAFQFRLRINGAYSNGASTDVTTSYQQLIDEWTTNPRTAAEWTNDDVNGVSVESIVNDNHRLRARNLVTDDEFRLTQNYLYVTYTEQVSEGSLGMGLDMDMGSFPGK